MENIPEPLRVDKNHQQQEKFSQRYALILIALAPVGAQIVATIFNVWYNERQINPLLTKEQLHRFYQTVVVYNSTIYLTAGGWWVYMPLSLYRQYRLALRGEAAESDRHFVAAQRRAINLPWYFGALAIIGWLMLIPAFLVSLSYTSDPLNNLVRIHLPISFIVSGSIGVTQGFFAVEWLSQRLLFPVFFRHSQPIDVPGAKPLSAYGRGLLWVVASVISPIASILLLLIAPIDLQSQQMYVLSVGVIAIAFALVSVVMLWNWISEPVRELRMASHAVGQGNLQTHINLLRADEFGPMINEFNKMVDGLREKERIRETFGRHVGREAARQILAENPDLIGTEKFITVMFADLRNFTARCEKVSPTETVKTLNIFLGSMVEIIESQGGMVNKFLGDGLMAIFGATSNEVNHCDQAVHAGQLMLRKMPEINRSLGLEPSSELHIGIGIHSGRAIVGSIGPEQRREFTAIGDTVNLASRIESLTKEVGLPLLFSASTQAKLSDRSQCLQLEPRHVKGKAEPIQIYSLCGTRSGLRHEK